MSSLKAELKEELNVAQRELRNKVHTKHALSPLMATLFQERRLSVAEDRLAAMLGTAKQNALSLVHDSVKMANDTAELADRTQDALIEVNAACPE